MFTAACFINAQKLKQSNWCMCKHDVVYPYNGILFSHKKEWSTDTCYNKDEPWKHYAKWKKSDTKGHILYNFIYMICLEKANP